MNFATLNTCPDEQAFAWFFETCSSKRWCEEMVRKRPFTSLDEVLAHTDLIWAGMDEPDLLEAFDGHPMIGDLSSLRKKYASTAALASGEQKGATEASEDTLVALRDANQQYLQRFGFIFIICATGLSAETMLDNLSERINNSRDVELKNAAKQQRLITRLRICKGLKNQSEDTIS